MAEGFSYTGVDYQDVVDYLPKYLRSSDHLIYSYPSGEDLEKVGGTGSWGGEYCRCGDGGHIVVLCV